ncbi:MAG: hypothetical protein ACFFC7_22915 [Candidatus Hermodarchaeota archaeon]
MNNNVDITFRLNNELAPQASFFKSIVGILTGHRNEIRNVSQQPRYNRRCAFFLLFTIIIEMISTTISFYNEMLPNIDINALIFSIPLPNVILAFILINQLLFTLVFLFVAVFLTSIFGGIVGLPEVARPFSIAYFFQTFNIIPLLLSFQFSNPEWVFLRDVLTLISILVYLWTFLLILRVLQVTLDTRLIVSIISILSAFFLALVVQLTFSIALVFILSVLIPIL